MVGVGPLPTEVVTHTVQPFHCDRVSGRVWSLPYVLGVTPSSPVGLHHTTHLPIQETVGQSDEKSLEGEENIPGEYEDCLQRSVWL